MPPAQRLVFDRLTAALAAYRPSAYEGSPVVFIYAETRLGNYFDPMPVWRRVASRGVQVINVAGSHLELVRSNAPVVAQHLDLLLAGARAPSMPGQAQGRAFKLAGST
jgi:acetoacetyl-CoA synthetase